MIRENVLEPQISLVRYAQPVAMVQDANEAAFYIPHANGYSIALDVDHR